MKTLFSILFISCLLHLNALETSSVFFKQTTSQEACEIQDHLIDFYGKELFKAGLFEDLTTSKKAGADEVREIQDSSYHFIISNDSGAQYGYLVYSLNDQVAFLESIYLDEIYRGQGLGIRSLQLLEDTLTIKGVQIIKLFVFAHNTAAFSLYVRVGYEIEHSYFEDDRLIGHHMKKEIKPLMLPGRH